LQNLAVAGKTVICTIHQPSSEVFALFDRILLMAEGRTAYLGPINDCLRFFSAQGLPCPTNYNPADFYIFTLAISPGKEVEARQKVKLICDAYNESEASRNVSKIVENEHRNIGKETEFDKDYSKRHSAYKANWFKQFFAVLWRSWLTVIRDPQILLVKLFSYLVCKHLLLYIELRSAYFSTFFFSRQQYLSHSFTNNKI
jgi:hypothetical protein